jgi:presenilin-like A22 family membrane protease
MKKTIRKKSKEKTEEWLSAGVIAKLTLVFLVVQIIGLFCAVQLANYGFAKGVIVDDVNDLQNSLYLFGMIILTTGIVIISLKLKKTRKLLLLFEILAIFSATWIVFSCIFPTNDLLAIALAIALVGAKQIKKEDTTIRTIASVLATAGAGAFIGITLGLTPAIVFMTILATYDIFAVYFTKHMISIGQEAKKNNFAFMVALHSKKHDFELGNGDLVMPLIISSSIITNGPFTNNNLIAALCLIASFIGLVISIYWVAKKKNAMPALPPQSALMLLIIIAATALGA